MKFRANKSVVVAFTVGVLIAGGIAWGTGNGDLVGSVVCQTPAGYLRVSATGECKRREIQVQLPQGPQGEQGLQGEQGPRGETGPQGSSAADEVNAAVEGMRCFQRLTRGADLHGCSIPAADFVEGTDLSKADLRDVTVRDYSPVPQLGQSRGYGHCAWAGAHIRCWGGKGDASNVPADLDAVEVVDIQSGVQTSCALLRSGNLRCWGSASYGQNSAPGDLGLVSQMALGDVHTCALTRAGVVRCWGIGRAGIQEVPADLGSVTQLVSGGDFACALNDAGAVHCWGSLPAVPDSLPKVVKLYAGANNVCAIDGADLPHCWGSDTTSLGSNFPADLGTVKEISGAVGGLCAITARDELRCWGGYVGWFAGAYRDGSETRPPADLGPVRQISMGVFHSCAVTLSNLVRCWGNDEAWSANFSFGAAKSKLLTLDGANISGANLAGLPIAKDSSACGLIGTPVDLPKGWSLIDTCLVQ